MSIIVAVKIIADIRSRIIGKYVCDTDTRTVGNTPVIASADRPVSTYIIITGIFEINFSFDALAAASDPKAGICFII